MKSVVTEEQFRKIASINVNSLNPDGTLKSLLEQYGEVQLRRIDDPGYRQPGPFVIAADGSFAGMPQMAGKPIVFSMSSLKHVVRKHGASIEVLTKLADEMAENVFCYESPESADKLTFLLDAQSAKGNDMITVVRTDLNMGHVNVVSVRSVHGKSREYLIRDIGEAIDENRRFVFGEKAGGWVEVQRSVPGNSGVTEEILNRLQGLFYQSIGARGSAESASGMRRYPLPERKPPEQAPASPTSDVAAAAREAAAQHLPARRAREGTRERSER